MDDPEVGGIRGWEPIGRYLGVSHTTARRWSRIHGLPVMWMPSGGVYTTKSLIDQWVFARAQLRYEALEAARLPGMRYTKNQGLAGENQSLTPDS